MNPKLTDDAVADLPLHQARADLLEEIMRTPALDDRSATTPAVPGGRRSRWLAPLAAAAAVAVLAGAVAWWADDSGPATPAPAGTGERSQAAEQDGAAQPTYGVVLDAPGWTATYVSVEKSGSEMSYENGRQRFDVSRYPADSYASYVEDRRHIVAPPADGEPVEVLGRPGQLWAYSDDDHTVIREVEAGSWYEFRGAGMDEAAFLDLLGQLRAVDRAGFEDALPAEFVTGDERAAAVDEILAGIEAEAGVLWPTGSVVAVRSDEVDRYQLGADVAGRGVACAWLDEFAAATRAGDQARAQQAADVLATSREWPILQEMDPQGGYPEAVWQYARSVAAGEVPEGYEGGLGCGS